jgi:putative ABC transport system permease protein
VMLLGFGLPPLLRLRGVPPMRVLNRSFAALPPVSILVYLAAIGASILLIVLATRDLRLALIVLGGLAALAGVSALAGFGLLSLLRLVQPRLRGHWRLGLASLARRRGLGVVQLVGLSLSLSALLLLAAIGPALLQQWRGQLPADTPNYFLLNVQGPQRGEVLEFLAGIGVENARLEPFATGRLIAINGEAPQARGFDPLDDAAAERPINMSWRRDFPPANTLLEGRFWDPDSTASEVSVEQGWAQRFGVGVDDVLSIGIGEQRIEARISNIRAADWDSFRVNFFLLLNENAVGDAPHNLVSAFHLPAGAHPRMGELSRRFPNVSLLDVDAILQRVREVIDRVAQAVQLVLGFSLAAGVLVLVAALQASASERRFESAVLRTLGARRRQLRSAVLAEFALVGGIASLLAVCGAALTGLLVARFGFEMGLDLPWGALLLGGALGTALAMLAGWLGTRSILRTPPARSLREA